MPLVVVAIIVITKVIKGRRLRIRRSWREVKIKIMTRTGIPVGELIPKIITGKMLPVAAAAAVETKRKEKSNRY